MVPFTKTGARWKRSYMWAATTTTNAPSGREGQPAVWTGHEMILWGGDDGLNFLNTGRRYDPVTDTWRSTSLTGALAGRFGHSFIWIADRLIVWGGAVGFGGDVNTGALYDPLLDTWSPTTTVGAPSARDGQAAIWTGSQMLVWGGISLGNYVNDGAFVTHASILGPLFLAPMRHHHDPSSLRVGMPRASSSGAVLTRGSSRCPTGSFTTPV